MRFIHRTKMFDIEGVSAEDHLVRSMEKMGTFYEVDLLEYIRQLMKMRRRSGRTMAVDVGANIGNHSVFMASFVADAVVCIEPNPAAIDLLRRNISKNAGDYSIYDCAVGDKDGFGKLFHPDQGKDNLGMARVETGASSGIRVATVDSVVQEWLKERIEHYDVSVMKIDVEGMELSVLKGAGRTISENRPDIFVEAVTQQDLRALQDHLKGLGYRRLSRRAVTPVYHFAFRPGPLLIIWAMASCLAWFAWKIRSRLGRAIMGSRVRSRIR